MYEGVVVLTNVLYIFLLVFDFIFSDPRAGGGGVSQSETVMMYAMRCLSMCLSHFRGKGSFIKVFHQSKKKCFFAVTATKTWGFLILIFFSFCDDCKSEKWNYWSKLNERTLRYRQCFVALDKVYCWNTWKTYLKAKQPQCFVSLCNTFGINCKKQALTIAIQL